MIRLAKITRLVENKPEAELAQEVPDFITFLEVNEEGSLVSRVSFLTDAKSKKGCIMSREVTLNLDVGR